MSPPVSIGPQRTDILVAPDAHAAAFAGARAMVCDDIVAPDLLASLLDRCHRTTFVADHVDRIGSREIEAPQRVGSALNVVLSRAPFLRWVEAATGCGALLRVEGRLVRTRANGVDGLDWHGDTHALGVEGVRRLGVTLNLSDAAFDGGEFELRTVATRATLIRHHHDRVGTALIFDIATDIEHRVLPLTGGGPRRVFTGWFMG